MPRGRKAAATPPRLDDLPRLPEVAITGGRRPLGIWIREGGRTVQPDVAIWLDGASGFIRATAVINPLDSPDGGLSETLDALEAAFTGPFLAPPGAGRGRGGQGQAPGLPAKVVVTDPVLAEAARARLAPLDIPVEQADDLPAFEEAYQSMSQALGADPDAGPPEPFAWAIDPATLPPLYKAAGGYARRAPWAYLPDFPPIVVALGERGPEPGVDTLYACVMGGGGMVTGLACYYSLDALGRAMAAGETIGQDDEILDAAIEELRQSGAPVDEVPREALRDLVAGFLPDAGAGGPDRAELGMQGVQDSLVLLLEDRDDVDPTYLEWLAERGIKLGNRRGVPSAIRTFPGGETRLPNEREAAALTLAIEAINGFADHARPLLVGPFLPAGGIARTVRVELGRAGGKVDVEARFDPFDPAWAELAGEPEGEPLPPASPEAATTLYRFLVALEGDEQVWRRIELRGDQTLEDLHDAIQDAFDWDDDHLYAFFLSGRAWDGATEYVSPYGDGRSAVSARLEDLFKRRGKKFLYIFDFGDEWRHRITLEAIARGEVEAGADYPRIAERHGDPPPQYPAWDDDEENEEE